MMTILPRQRQMFIKDFEEAQEELCFNMAHLDKEEAIDNIMTILYALRIASIIYNEHNLQKHVEVALASMINNDCKQDMKTVKILYELTETIVYPYKNNMIHAA